MVLTLLARPGCEVNVSTTRGNFRFRPAEIDTGDPRQLEIDAQIIRLPVVRNIGSTSWDDDYGSIAADRSGGLWVAWAGYHNGQDEVGVRHYKDGVWSNYLPVPGNYGDVWWPQVVIDEKNDPWVVFAQQDGGNWDLYATRYEVEGKAWSKLERITDDPGGATLRTRYYCH